MSGPHIHRVFCAAGHDLRLPNATYGRQCRLCKLEYSKRRHRDRHAEAARAKPPKEDHTLRLLDLWKQHENAMPFDRADIRKRIEELQST